MKAAPSMRPGSFAELARNFYPRFKKVRIGSGRVMPAPSSINAAGLPAGVAREIGLEPGGKLIKSGYGLNRLPAGISTAEFKNLPAQGYFLSWDEAPVVWGKDYAGLYYGCVTLVQLLRLARESGIKSLPRFRIADYPDMPRRGVMVDYGRGLSFNLEWAKRFILRLAGCKVNEFHFYFENRLEMKTIPLFAPEHSATQAEIKDLVRWARGHAVTIVPHANMLAHTEELLRTQRYAHLREEQSIENAYMMCPSNPETKEILRREIRECARLFKSDFIHVGCDEPSDLGRCPRCARRAKKDGAKGLYLEHVRFLKREIERCGKKLALWGDVLWHDANASGTGGAGRMLRKVLAGAVVFDWCYGGARPASLRFLKKNGFATYAATTTLGWCGLFDDYEPAMKKALAFLRDAHRACVMGSIICIWEVHRGARADHQLPAACQYGAAMWDKRKVASRDFLAFYGRSMFGPATDKFAEFTGAMCRMTRAELSRSVLPRLKDHQSITRGWRYEVFAASDPLYAWKNLRHTAGSAARFFYKAADTLDTAWQSVRRTAVRNQDLLTAYLTPIMCLRTAALRLTAGSRLARAYRLMDRLPTARRQPLLRAALAALDGIGRDLAGHERFERRCISLTGGDYFSLECMQDVHACLAGWKRAIRKAANSARMPDLELLLSFRNYRDPYPTSVRRFDTNKTLKID
ncbi:MAG: family 20 glycosylhydrolase [Kiritimatiellota bacterium]|nr:family 20 glycosylhydrolase [Kiritimatiellota bacterium]